MASIDQRPATAAIQSAEDAHEAVRALIRVTLQRPAHPYPSDLDAVIGSLHLLVDQLPQAIRQAEEWLDQEHDAGRVGDVRSGAEAASMVAVESVAMELTAARVVARRLAEHLRAARANTAHIGDVTGIEQ